MGPGARPLFRPRLGHDVRAAARAARSSAESAAGAERRPARGPGWPRHLCVDGLELFPATAGGGAWGLSLVRKPVGIEAAECSVKPYVVRRTSCVACSRCSDARRTTHECSGTCWAHSPYSCSDARGITVLRWSSTVLT